MLNIVVVFCGFLIAVVLARIIIPRILIISQDFLQSGDFKFGPGDVKYADLNGDGKLGNGAGTVEDPGDKEIIGNETPRFEYGIRLGADYKGFDFSIFMQGVGKRQIWGNGFLAIPGYNTPITTIFIYLSSLYYKLLDSIKKVSHYNYSHSTNSYKYF